MDSERTQAELYVTQYNLRCCNVEMLREIVVLYGLFAYFAFFVAQVGQTYVCASILTVFTVLYWIITGVMLWTMKEVTFYQSALFSGVGAVLRGLYFSSVGLVFVEVYRLSAWYYIGALAAWGICTLLRLWPDWYRVRRCKYQPREMDEYGYPVEEFTYEQRMRGGRILLVLVALFVVFWVVYIKIIYPQLGRAGIPTTVVLLSFLLGQAMEIGTPGLLKAYYIKKYDISGEPLPVRNMRWGPKPSLFRRVVWFAFKWLFIGAAVMFQVWAFLMPK